MEMAMQTRMIMPMADESLAYDDNYVDRVMRTLIHSSMITMAMPVPITITSTSLIVVMIMGTVMAMVSVL